jgi:prepilin-type N-terminal cleavage/methylation domain-containing protein
MPENQFGRNGMNESRLSALPLAKSGTPRCESQSRSPSPLGRGFTLVELLVVVSIIALLIAILLPSLSSARDQAKAVKCLAHTRSMATAGMVFTGDHNGRFQLSAVEGDGIVGVSAVDPGKSIYEYDSNGELLTWPVALAEASSIDYGNNWKWGVRADTFEDAYGKRKLMGDDLKMATCPADEVLVSTPFYPRGSSLQGPGDPDNPYNGGDSTAYWGFLSFGINEDVVGTEFDTKDGKPWLACWKNGVMGENELGSEQGGARLRGKLDRVYDPSTCLLIADAGPNSTHEALNGEFTVESNGLGYANLITSAKARGPYLEHAVFRWVQRIPTKRHPKGAIDITFADFHAESVKPVAWRRNNILGGVVPARYSARVRAQQHPG